MNIVWEILAGLCLALWLGIAALVRYGVRSIPDLRRIEPDSPPRPDGWPSVRIVVAARDEAAEIETALRSLLALDYPHLEIVVVDDRSTDGTGAILDRVAARDPRVRVVHVDALPDGWLGKNHALHVGAQGAETDWLLFTDADVRFRPDALRKAVRLAEAEGADHLACSPGLISRSLSLDAMVAFFSLLFALFVQAFLVANPRSGAHVGIGAFNLVRTSVYRAIGGHTRIRLRPDDDLKLGKVIKQAGYRQRLAIGRGWVDVPWYHDLAEMARGLEKNTYAPFEYNLWRALLTGVPYFFTFTLPWTGLLLAPSGTARLLFGGAVAVMLLVAAIHGQIVTGRAVLSAVTLPVASLVFAGIFLRAVWLTHRRGGIVWRDHFYPLERLRENRV